MNTATAIQIALAALLVGVALPLLVQLFMTARALQHTAQHLDRRLDATFNQITSLTAARSPTSEVAAAIGAALVPAALAAVRTLRAPHQEQSNGTSETARGAGA